MKNPLSPLKGNRNLITIFLIASFAITFLVSWGLRVDFTVLAFFAETATKRPWTFLSYPFAPSSDFLGTVFACWWLYSVGGLIESDQSKIRYAAILAIYTLLAALCFFVGTLVTGTAGYLWGSWGILSCVTVLWGSRYPSSTVLFMFVIPIQAKWLALLSVGLVFFGAPPQLALFAALPLLIAYLFAKDKLPLPYSPHIKTVRARAKTRSGMPTSPEFLADVKKREKEREEKERLRKLFETNLIDNEKSDQ